MATIGTSLQMLPAKFAGAPYRSTDATIFCVKEGRGQSKTTCERGVFSWGPRDIFVVPSWMPVSHQASEQAILFSGSRIVPSSRRCTYGAKRKWADRADLTDRVHLRVKL